jgi:tRNA A-37 threonylcarbamoyl transferase component Bud32
MSAEVLAWWRGWLSPIFHASLRHQHDNIYQCGVLGTEVVLPRTHQYNQPCLFLIIPRFNFAKTIQTNHVSFSYRIYVVPDTVTPPANAPQLRDINELEAFLQSLNSKFLHSDFKNAFATTFQPPIPLPVPTTFVGTTVVDELPVGKVVHGEWEVVRRLGKGGMGAVYEVRHKIIGWRAALKMCVPDATDPDERRLQREQFLNEARALAQLSDPRIVRLYDVWDSVTGTVFILEEFVDGRPLSQFIPSPEPFVLWVGTTMCEILEVIHSRNIIHRDIKPDNIMVVGQMQLKLIDFGIARRYKPHATQDTMAWGTEGYAPPEQYGQGQTDARSDIYALAATLYHLLYDDDPRYHPFQFPKLLSNNAAINAVLKKALDLDPAKRFQSAREFGEALRRC